jgi:dCTP deaminase
MSALGDTHILSLLRTKELIIHPLLDPAQIHGGRIDLRLGNILYFIERFEKEYYNPMDYVGKKPARYVRERVIPFEDKFVLHPNDYALAPLFECVKIPPNHIGRLDGRSSLGRLGIVVHSTAGAVDPEYSGPLVMELMNHGMLPVVLYPLMRIATMMLYQLSGESEGYKGKYRGLQEFFGVESKLNEDSDVINMKKAMEEHTYI